MKITDREVFDLMHNNGHSIQEVKEWTDKRQQETLRDEFAKAAMQGIVFSIDGEDNYQRIRAIAMQNDMNVSEWIARDAYKQADAMLKARQQ